MRGCTQDSPSKYYTRDLCGGGKKHSSHESTSRRRISSPVKQIIKDKIRDGKTAALIKQDLMGMPNVTTVPLLQQIENFASYQKREEALPATLEDLLDYAMSKTLPASVDEAYVCSFASRKNNGSDEFCLVWSSTKLRDFQSNSKFISVDSTYNLNWNGYPVMVSGFGDANKIFFLTHLALASNENGWCYEQFFRGIKGESFIPSVVTADGDQSISLGARNVWPDAKRAMCHFHVKQNLRKHMKLFGIPKETKGELYSDVDILQRCSSMEEFSRVGKALAHYWSVKYTNNRLCTAFKDHFFSTWVESDLCGWFEGFSSCYSTSNGLESSNRVIKDCATLRKKLVLRAFLHAAERMMRNSSMDPDRQAPALVPKISPQVYKEAYKLEQESRPLYQTAINGFNFSVIPSATAVDQNVPELFMQLIQGGYSFEQFKKSQVSLSLSYSFTSLAKFLLLLLPDGWKESTMQALCDVDEEASNTTFPRHAIAEPLGKKRKRGRPCRG